MGFTLPQSPIIATVGVVKRLQRVFSPHFMSRTPLLPRSERMAPWCELPGPSDVKMVYSFSSTWMVVSRFGFLSSVLYVALPLLSLSFPLPQTLVGLTLLVTRSTRSVCGLQMFSSSGKRPLLLRPGRTEPGV